LVKEPSQANIDWIAVSALAALIVALVALFTIIFTHIWNKRNELMKVLPLLSLKQPSEENYRPENLGSLDSGWFRYFELVAENVGLGPIVAMKIAATQGNLRFRLTLPRDQSSEDSQLFGVRERRRLGFYLIGNPKVPSCNPEMIKIEVLLRDVYARPVVISYQMHPLLNQKNRFIPMLGIPLVTSLTIDGKKIPIPEASEIQPPGHAGD